jgi:uncharacterized protein YijF (DUF1287 family)
MITRRATLAGLLSLPLSPALAEGWTAKLVSAAEDQIGRTTRYDGSYVKIAYPGGDVPLEYGVCTDVVIRAYRTGLGIDLQKLIHDDMRRNFKAYPTRWGLKRPDPNIDHRRVPNLQTFFQRRGAERSVSTDARDYAAGDLVTMLLPGNLPHIAIVSGDLAADSQKPLLIHNIGAGTQKQDVLFAFGLTGHYRFAGS